MADDGPELNVNVRLSGAQEAADGIKSIGQAGEEAGDQAEKGLGKSAHTLRELLMTSRHSHEIFEGIERAGEGSAQSILGLVRAFRAFVVIVAEAVGASGPLGLLLIALGAIGGAFLAFGHRAKEAGDGLKETGKGADSAKEALKGLDEESKTALEAMKKDLQDANADWKELEGRIEGAAKANAEAAKANRGLEDAKSRLAEAKEIAASTSPEQRDEIRNRYESQRKFTEAQRREEDAANAGLTAQVESEYAQGNILTLTGKLQANRRADAEQQDRKTEALRVLNLSAVQRDQAQQEAGRAALAARQATGTSTSQQLHSEAYIKTFQAQQAERQYQEALKAFQTESLKAAASAKNLAEVETTAAQEMKDASSVLERAKNELQNSTTEASTAQIDEQTAKIEANQKAREDTESLLRDAAEENQRKAEAAQQKEQRVDAKQSNQEAAASSHAAALADAQFRSPLLSSDPNAPINRGLSDAAKAAATMSAVTKAHVDNLAKHHTLTSESMREAVDTTNKHIRQVRNYQTSLTNP